MVEYRIFEKEDSGCLEQSASRLDEDSLLTYGQEKTLLTLESILQGIRDRNEIGCGFVVLTFDVSLPTAEITFVHTTELSLEVWSFNLESKTSVRDFRHSELKRPIRFDNKPVDDVKYIKS